MVLFETFLVGSIIRAFAHLVKLKPPEMILWVNVRVGVGANSTKVLIKQVPYNLYSHKCV